MDSVMSQVEKICSATKDTITVKLTSFEELKTQSEDDYGKVWMLTVVDRHGVQFKLLYVPAVSTLLSTDSFLIPRSLYLSSVDEPIIATSAPIRKLFAVDATSSTNNRGEWAEGTIYHIREDYKENPYNSISVVWLQQEAVTNQWVYEYSQMDNLCSPWDLQLSEYYLLKNVKDATLPKSLSVGCPTPMAVLVYICSLDCSENFKIPVHQNKEFCQMFKNEADRIG